MFYAANHQRTVLIDVTHVGKRETKKRQKREKCIKNVAFAPSAEFIRLWETKKLARNAMQNLAHKSMHVETRTESTIMSSTESIQEFCMPKGKNKESAQDAESGKLFWGGRSTCGICADKNRKMKAETSHNIGFEMREKLHMCRFCSNPVKSGYKVCEKHYQMCVDKLKHPKCIEARAEYKKMINRSINARREKKIERICN